MSQKRLWISAGIIALVIIIGFAISVPHTAREVVPKTPVQAMDVVPTVTLRDTFKKGLHTITGSVMAPDACTVVMAEARLLGDASSTQSIQIALSLPPSSGVCLELPTRMNFSTTIVAPAQLPVSALINGSTASTTSS